MDLSKSFEYFDPSKINDRIHIVGCGSVGSTVATLLARTGITKMTLWDFDLVEPHNLVNQMYRTKDIAKPKVEALADILTEINPDIQYDIKLRKKGWDGQLMSGYIFLAVDNIELRKKIVELHMPSSDVKAMFDFRTGLEDAQHYATEWNDVAGKKNFLASMDFSHDEAKAETPVSACGVTLGVCPTVWGVSTCGVVNFINLITGKHPLRHMVVCNVFNMDNVAI